MIDDLKDLECLLGGKDAILTLGTFACFINAYASEEAIKQMDDNDFILAIDARPPKEDEPLVLIQKGKDKKIHALRHSARQKYKNIYEEILYAKLQKIIKEK